MALLWDINATRTELRLPKEAHKLAASYVGVGDAAFSSMYEFWFGCIAYAVRTGASPVSLPPTSSVGFVSAGPGTAHIALPEWMATLLVCAYLSEFAVELAAEDFDPAALSSTAGDAPSDDDDTEPPADDDGGSATPSVLPVTAKLVIRHANALAAAGAKGFLDSLKEMRGTSSTPVLAAAKLLSNWRAEDADMVQAEFPELIRPLTLSSDPDATNTAAISSLIQAGESRDLEFKATGRVAVETGQPSPGVEWAVARAVAALMNAESGGTLLIGVGNDGSVVGLERDYPFVKYKNRDGWELWFTELLSTTLGTLPASEAHVTFVVVNGSDVARISIPPAGKAVFATPRSADKKPQVPHFYVRVNNGTKELHGPELLEYQKKRWPSG